MPPNETTIVFFCMSVRKCKTGKDETQSTAMRYERLTCHQEYKKSYLQTEFSSQVGNNAINKRGRPLYRHIKRDIL